MPLPTPVFRYTTYYTTLKTTAITALGIPETPTRWGWEGIGLDGHVIVQISSIPTPNTPQPGITRVRDRHIIYPMRDIKAQFFSTLPDAVFSRLTIAFDATNVIFNLNLEEAS